MNVLVTGTSGRIGSAIHARLLRDHRVIALDRVPSRSTNVVGDLREASIVRAALRGVHAVVHVAAYHAPHVGRVAESEFEKVNVHATRLLAELAAEAGVGRFVFTSTTALYGGASTPPAAAGWVDEGLAPQPRTIYHRTKLAAESLLGQLARQGAFQLTVLRMSRCFPEPAPLMAAYRVHRGVDARDVAEAHALALGASPSACRSFLISGATPFQREDVAELLRDAPSVLVRRAPALVRAFAARGWRLPPSIDRVYSPARAMDELGWRPRYGFEEVLRQADEGPGTATADARWKIMEPC